MIKNAAKITESVEDTAKKYSYDQAMTFKNVFQNSFATIQ
jgi:hypothetical protein